MAVTTPAGELGWRAAPFRLPSTDGETLQLEQLRGEKGTLVVFICNHCPYVLAVLDRVIRDAESLKPLGVDTVAISSNDAVAYPDDSFEMMAKMAKQHGFGFPYLYDESQEIARGYDAVCTPDFFGFDANLHLRYRGRIDASGRTPAPADAPRELFEAMKTVAETGLGPPLQHPSMGCSIKWRE